MVRMLLDGQELPIEQMADLIMQRYSYPPAACTISNAPPPTGPGQELRVTGPDGERYGLFYSVRVGQQWAWQDAGALLDARVLW